MKVNGLDFVPRKPNLDCIARLGFRIDDVENTIYGLKEEDYSKGPERDNDGSPGEI
jgi:hypothetical protein